MHYAKYVHWGCFVRKISTTSRLQQHSWLRSKAQAGSSGTSSVSLSSSPPADGQGLYTLRPHQLWSFGIQFLTSILPDWNSNDAFFTFTRGRFVVDEAENLRKREIRFDLNQLAQVAADAVGASYCISVKKYPDGMFNKAFVMTMDNGREVVAKVPNPNAGIPHYTTASEVATMDFVSSQTRSYINNYIYYFRSC